MPADQLTSYRKKASKHEKADVLRSLKAFEGRDDLKDSVLVDEIAMEGDGLIHQIEKHVQLKKQYKEDMKGH